MHLELHMLKNQNHPALKEKKIHKENERVFGMQCLRLIIRPP